MQLDHTMYHVQSYCRLVNRAEWSRISPNACDLLEPGRGSGTCPSSLLSYELLLRVNDWLRSISTLRVVRIFPWQEDALSGTDVHGLSENSGHLRLRTRQVSNSNLKLVL